MADKEKVSKMSGIADVKTPGEVLKKAREKLNKSLKDVSDELHLDRWMIEAIERDDFPALGAPVFAKGHLKQYAKLLGLNADDLMVGYYQVSGSREQPPLIAQSVLRAEGQQEKDFKWVLPLLIILAVIGIIAFAIYWYMQPAEEPSSVGSESGEISMGAELQLTEAAQIPVEVVSGNAALAVPRLTAANSLDTSTRDEAPAEENLLVTVEDAPEEVEVDVVDDAAQPIVSDNVTVTMRFTEESWVEIYDGKRQKLLYGLVESATVKYLSGPPPIQVFLGRQNAVSIEVNGAPFVIPRDAMRGNTARFRIDKPT